MSGIVRSYQSYFADLEKILANFETLSPQYGNILEYRAMRNSEENRLMDAPVGIISMILSDYSLDNELSVLDREKSKSLGMGTQIMQYESIIKLSQLVILANRFKNMTDNPRFKAYSLDVKCDAISALISSIYIYEQLDGGEHISYGLGEDEQGKDVFTIDIPGMSQISVHFGTKANEERVLKNAKDQIKSMLLLRAMENPDKKEKAQELLRQITSNDKYESIIPEYTMPVYELDAGYPLRSKDRLNKWVVQSGLFHCKPDEVADEFDILRYYGQEEEDKAEGDEILARLLETDLTPRELHFLAVKYAFSREAIQELDDRVKIRDSKAKKALHDVREEYSSLTRDDVGKGGKVLDREEKAYDRDMTQ